jgi:trehalose 6-phosphate phosphatase
MPRLRSLWLSLSEISRRIEQSESLHIATDFDGTLIPIVEHPDQAGVPERTRAVLHRLAELPELDLAILSGRRLDDLEHHFNGGRLFLAGAGGLESRDEQGRRQVHLPADARLPEPLRQSLDAWCESFPGSWVEDKRFSYSLHYRAVPAARQPAFGAGVRRRARPFRGQAQLVHGKRVFEIMPAVPWEKSAALGLWLDSRATRGTLIYFGDDTNDEPVHRAVRERGGIAVAVGRAVSAAEYGLPSPTEVVWFMEWLEREWSARGEARAGDSEAAPLRESVGA